MAWAVENWWIEGGAEPPRFEDRAFDASLSESAQVAVDRSPSGQFPAALGSSFLVLFLGLSILNGWIDRGLDRESVEKEKSAVLLLSQISLALYALHLVAGDAVPLYLRNLVHCLAILPLLSVVAKHVVSRRMRSDRRWALVWSLLNDSQLMLAGLFMPAAVISIGGLAAGWLNPMAGLSFASGFVVYLVVLLVLFSGYAWVGGQVARASQRGMALALYDLNTAVVVAGAPVILIPLGILLANEIQFAVPALSPRSVGLAVVAILFAAAVALFALHRRGRVKVGAAAMLAGFYFPAMVVTLASFATHRWTLDLGVLDYYRSGQSLLPAQQWSDLGSVPLLDLSPSHGLADFGIQSLFTLLNGVHDLDMLVWLPWIPVVVGFLLIYCFLAVVTSPLLAVLVTILLPVRAAVVGQYALVLMPAVMVAVTLKRPSFQRFLVMWMTTALLLLWRPRLGWPAALTVLVVVGVVVYFENREALTQAVSSLAIVLGLVPAGLLIAEVTWGGDTYAALVDYLALFRRFGERGFGAFEIGPGMGTVGSFLVQILPVVAVVCLLVFCMRKLMRRESFGTADYAIFYLVVFSLTVPAHSWLHRDVYLFDPSLLLLTLALMPFVMTAGPFRPRQIGRSSWLMASLVLCAVLGPLDLYHLLGNGTGSGELHTWKTGEPRVLFASAPHRGVVDLLQQELSSDESFLDFTGSAALYALSGKQYPLRAITDFRTTSESRQRSQLAALEDQRATGNLPLVVFRSSLADTEPAGDLATAMISYRITDFIYSQYLPWAKVEGWEIWRQRGVQKDKPAPPAKLIRTDSIQQDFRLGLLPYRWADQDPWESLSQTKVLVSLLESRVMTRVGVPFDLEWSVPESSDVGTYLHVRARPLLGQQLRKTVTAKPTLTVRYGMKSQSSFGFQLVQADSGIDESHQPIALGLRDDPKKHALRRLDRGSGRLVFESDGRDPWLHRIADLSAAPDMEAGVEQWIRLGYRSTKGGQTQFFFATEDDKFSESHSVKASLMATGSDSPVQSISAPVLGVENGRRLAKLRLDPPSDGEFEIVSLELIRRRPQSEDYLIRLSTQFEWANGKTDRLTLESNTPVVIDGVYLRTGD